MWCLCLCVGGFKRAAAFPDCPWNIQRREKATDSHKQQLEIKPQTFLKADDKLQCLQVTERWVKCCSFLQALREKGARHCRDKGVFQSAAVPATLKALADHQTVFGQDCYKQISIFKVKKKEKTPKKISTAFPSFHLHESTCFTLVFSSIFCTSANQGNYGQA